MLGWVKCGACGKRFRPQRGRRRDLCPGCSQAGFQARVLGEHMSSLGDSELDQAERRVREAQLRTASGQEHGVDAMAAEVAEWQQLNSVLNANDGVLSESERREYGERRRELERSDSVRAFLREAKHRQRRDSEMSG